MKEERIKRKYKNERREDLEKIREMRAFKKESVRKWDKGHVFKGF